MKAEKTTDAIRKRREKKGKMREMKIDTRRKRREEEKMKEKKTDTGDDKEKRKKERY